MVGRGCLPREAGLPWRLQSEPGKTCQSQPDSHSCYQTDPRFGPILVSRGLPCPLWANRSAPPLAPVSPDPLAGTCQTHPELKPLPCSQARTSEALERGLSCGSGVRGPGAARLGPTRPWARRACSSSLILSIWENFSAGGKPGGRADSGRRALGSEGRGPPASS